jgi:hypothetical protein
MLVDGMATLIMTHQAQPTILLGASWTAGIQGFEHFRKEGNNVDSHGSV